MTRKFINPRVIRFIIGGSLNTGFTYLMYLLFSLWLSYQWSYLIAYVLGVLLAYWFNASIVFKHHLSLKGLATYPLVYVVQYAISAIFLHVIVEKYSVPISIAPIAVIAATLPLTYFLNKLVLEWTSPKVGQKNG